jgi:hypothetical protein
VVSFIPLSLYLQGGKKLKQLHEVHWAPKVGLGSSSEEKSLLPLFHESRDSVDSIAAVWTVRVSVPERVKSVFLLRKCPDTVWSPPNLLFNGYQAPWVKVARDRNLTTYLHLVLRWRMSGAIHLLPHASSWRGQGKSYLFLWALKKITKGRLLTSSCLSFRSSIHMEQLGSHWKCFHEIWCLSKVHSPTNALLLIWKTHWNLH